MAFEPALRTRLKNDTAVAAIVGARIDWTMRPQGSAYPAVVIDGVSDSRPQHMKGLQVFRDTRVQFNCFAQTKAVASALRDAVIAAILPEATAGGVTFRRGFVNDVVPRFSNTDTGPVFNELIDATFWHNA